MNQLIIKFLDCCSPVHFLYALAQQIQDLTTSIKYKFSRSTDKLLVLDSNVLSETSNIEFAHSVRQFIKNEGYTLVISVMHLMETMRATNKFPAICEFVASVPFMIAANPDVMADLEVRNYPNEICLPIGFRSSDHNLSHEDLVYAIGDGNRQRIEEYSQWYTNNRDSILQGIVNVKNEWSAQAGLDVFLQMSVFTRLEPRHVSYLRRYIERNRCDINIRQLKSIYIQSASIYTEYVLQTKKGTPSDIGDLLLISCAPYVDLSVLDKERCAMIGKINKKGLVDKEINVKTLSEFKKMLRG